MVDDKPIDYRIRNITCPACGEQERHCVPSPAWYHAPTVSYRCSACHEKITIPIA